MPTSNSDYPDTDFPWNFYFNGELMPKWTACWSLAGIGDFVRPDRNPDADVSGRDLYIIMCSIDHVGTVESADPDIFLYAVQEVLYLLLKKSDEVLATISADSLGSESATNVYAGLVEGALSMRQLAIDRDCAFWISGYEADNTRLKEAMRRAAAPQDSKDYAAPPHEARLRASARALCEEQLKRLHGLSQVGRFDKTLRRRLHELGLP